MGGLVQVKYNGWTAWTGGKPNTNWLDGHDDNGSATQEQGAQIHTIKDSMCFEELMKGLDTKCANDGACTNFR